MKNKQEVSKKERGAAVGLVVCFVAMIAIVGMVTFSQTQEKTDLEEQQLAKTEEKEEGRKEDSELSQITNTDAVQAEIKNPITEKNSEVTSAPTKSLSQELTFSGADVLLWPVDGNVLLSYSMDARVYFSTLDQYKYNPSLIIEGEIGEEVKASATGEIISIKSDARTGTTITMAIGSGYELVYGQLKEVKVKKGQRVSQGDVIGYVCEPTKYFNVEGPNLYFQVLKDGEPVNPLEYLEA